jgi:hypothetical protein
MRPSRLLVTTLATAIAVLSLPSVARAATTAADCTITAAGPQTVVVGSTPEPVQFYVDTKCDAAGNVKWSVQAENIPHSPHVSWLAACTYQYSGPAVFDCSHGGATTVDPFRIAADQLNVDDLAGTMHPLYAFAFQDTNANNRFDSDEPNDQFTTTFTLLRQTRFDGPLRVSQGEPRAGKKVTLRARIVRANWTTGKDQALDAPVLLQFRPNGGSDFQDVATVFSDRGHARARIRVQTSGEWRFAYAGSPTDAESVSAVVAVTVPAG